MALIFPISPLTSSAYLGKAFVVCVLGGLGSVSGALAGGLLLALVEGIGSTLIGPAHATTLSFVLLITAVVVMIVSASKLGFGLNCIRQNETASNMVGLNSTLYKSVAFGLSACFVGSAGGIYAAWVHYIDPSDVFDILYSVKPIVMALMGGLGSPLGVVCGAFVYLGLEEVVWRNYIQIHSGVLGVLIIMLLLFLPHGLISLRSGMFWRKAKHV